MAVLVSIQFWRQGIFNTSEFKSRKAGKRVTLWHHNINMTWICDVIFDVKFRTYSNKFALQYSVICESVSIYQPIITILFPDKWLNAANSLRKISDFQSKSHFANSFSCTLFHHTRWYQPTRWLLILMSGSAGDLGIKTCCLSVNKNRTELTKRSQSLK